MLFALFQMMLSSIFPSFYDIVSPDIDVLVLLLSEAFLHPFLQGQALDFLEPPSSRN